LFCPESTTNKLHREALRTADESQTALTNIFTGRPARGIVNRMMRELGPISPIASAFPLAGGPLIPLRAIAEPQGNPDFMSLWAGQAVGIKHQYSAAQLTETMAQQALEKLVGR
jgi:nitronate monooxygenase